ncbi:MAG: hypothetical protein J0I74_07410 [Rhodanobacter sp.]|nr:hypothetical protein [Rhodanobacter sp.]
MIELEIQALSERRDGLLIEVGRLVLASGFSLQRQRLVQDPHGILLTMVVRGPPRKRRALAAALDAHERIISFELEPVTEGEERPHFAASRAPSAYVPPVLPVAPPAPEAAAPTAPARPAAATAPAAPAFDQVAPVRLVAPTAASAPPPAVDARPTPEPDLEFILPPPVAAPVAAPAPAVVAEAPFVELVPLEPDQAAIDKLLAKLASEYPQIMQRLQQLDRAVAEAAREPTLALAGRRTGAWLAQREPAAGGQLNLEQAIAQLGMPALRALIEVEQDGSQLHIHHSPLCGEPGHSGCIFFSGFLEGLLAPVLGGRELSIFAVCCRSYGADDCVLALSD